jgi:hypothetical protein
MNLSLCPSEFIFEPVTLSEAAALLLVVILGNAALDPTDDAEENDERGGRQRTSAPRPAREFLVALQL